MKRFFTILAAVLLTATLWAQNPPQKMSYQAVIRNSSNVLVASSPVGMRISILQGSAGGTVVYTETQTPTTNVNGLVSIEIGGGMGFDAINWANGPYFIKTETDPTGGTSYTITGTSQLLSVPFALYAKTAASYSETDPIFGVWNKSTGISITSSQVNDFQTSVTNNADVLLNTAKNSYPTADATKLAAITGTNTGDETTETIKSKLGITTLSGSNTGDQDIAAMAHTNRTALDAVSGINTGDQTLSGLGGVASNTPITGATKTKITYDAKGLVTSGTDATTADIAASTDKNYVTDAQLTVIGNTSGTNTGDNATNTQYSGLVTNATHTGDATGSTALTVVRINGTSLAGLETGILKNTTSTGVPSIAVAGTDYLTPTGSAALLTGFPTLNQNTTGSSASFTGSLVGDVTGTQGATVVGNSAVISKVLTGYTSGAGTVAATDNILQAIQKLNGNNPVHTIGESYGGGIVFYVYDNGKHGLIAATADQNGGATIRWYGGSYTNTRARADGVGAGLKNTAIIIANQGPVDGNAFAATVCNEYSVTVGSVTYGDWYLPSKYELNLLYLQKGVVGGFAVNYYWSSTEGSNNSAWLQLFFFGDQYDYDKSNTYYVRAVRAF